MRTLLAAAALALAHPLPVAGQTLNEKSPLPRTAPGTQEVRLEYRLRVQGVFQPGGGLRVVSVDPAGPGAHLSRTVGGQPVYGALEVGDVITAVGGRPVRGPRDYYDALNASGPDLGRVRLTVRDVNSGREFGWDAQAVRVKVIGPPVNPPPTGRATALKVLLVGDTDDKSIGRMIAVSVATVRRELEAVPGYRADHVQVLTGPAVSARGVKAALDRLAVGPTEAVLYYHIGHGAYDPALAAGDPSGGHHFQLPDGALPRKAVRDRLAGKHARFVALVSDTCNVRAAAVLPPRYETVMPEGPSWVLGNLFLDHTGTIDVGGSSRDQYGWFSSDVGGWFTAALTARWDPDQFRGDRFATWNKVVRLATDETSRTFQARKQAILKNKAAGPEVVAQLTGQPDQRPQVFVNTARPVK